VLEAAVVGLLIDQSTGFDVVGHAIVAEKALVETLTQAMLDD